MRLRAVLSHLSLILVVVLVTGCSDSKMRRRVAAMDTETLERLSKEYPADSKAGRAIADELSRRPRETPSPPVKRESSRPSGILPGIRSFLNQNREFGSATTTQPVPDWAQGKRQRVQFTSGRNLLFYLKDGEVVTVYEDTEAEGRKKIWGSYSSGTAEYAKDVSRPEDGAIPEYTVISAINLLAGGKHADVLIPSLSRNTPRETRSEVAFAIQKKEGLRSLSMYSTREAYKADYSSSFAEQNPGASEGRLGSISMQTGTFSD